MCVQSIKVPIRKKSGNLFYDPRMFKCSFRDRVFNENNTYVGLTTMTLPICLNDIKMSLMTSSIALHLKVTPHNPKFQKFKLKTPL